MSATSSDPDQLVIRSAGRLKGASALRKDGSDSAGPDDPPAIELDPATLSEIMEAFGSSRYLAFDLLTHILNSRNFPADRVDEVVSQLRGRGLEVLKSEALDPMHVKVVPGPAPRTPPRREPPPVEGGTRDPLTTAEVRQLQTILNEISGVELPVDGVLGTATMDDVQIHRPRLEGMGGVAADLARRAALLTPLPTQEAAGNVPPNVWIFYGTDRGPHADWIDDMVPGDTIFWRHGTTGGAYRKQLRRGDTVLLLVGQEFIANGVLLADDQARFTDNKGRTCRPVGIIDRYAIPFSRGVIERAAGVELVRQGAVHPVPLRALSLINETQRRNKFDTLPRPRAAIEKELSWPRVVDELMMMRTGDILPDTETAALLGWTGPRRDPKDEPDLDLSFLATEPPPAPDAARKRARVRKAAQAPAPKVAPKPADAAAAKIDARIRFVLDAPKDSEDQLERGPFALFLAQRLHLIWCQTNGHAPDEKGKRMAAIPADSDTFIVHVDSPWGGGKTSFANFIARVLDPRGQVLDAGHFLRSSLAPTVADDALAAIPLEEVFVPPYARKGAEGWEQWSGARQPWIIARYNAWRDQYVQPPWWQVFLKIQSAVTCEVRRDAVEALRHGELLRADRTITRWLAAKWERIAYQVWNRKLQGQLIPWLLIGGSLWLLWGSGALDLLLGASRTAAAGPVEAKKLSDWLALGVTVLGLGGASIAAVFTIISQSFAPDLDFTAEHKQIGVQDPIGRFRRSFDRILRATDRPVLLIVDDLDRCEPKTVVELMRGFQTIIRSPRLFVLLLGDRAWIENAHDVVHRELSAVREGEDGLGARFVQKMIQLSFRLPTMKPEARTRFAHSVLGDKPADPAAKEVAAVLRQLDEDVSKIVGQTGSVGSKEADVAQVVEKAKAALPDTLTAAEVETAGGLAENLANVKIVASAGADTALQRSVDNAVTRLITSLPNNPRQIKRIFMAFATYEVVGRVYFGYQLTAEGPDGERRARRWRQLAMWVTLAIEWPETWRAVARRPGLLDVAYAEPKARKRAEAALLAPLSDTEKAEAAATLERLRGDRALIGLLSHDPRASALADDFAGTVMETEAIYEFNRIIWEPGFELEARVR